ncbi:hypothetical protein [Chitinophaga sp.]|uniref:CIS tube protein n=1 Tax=Chitinophaga sp. TaxID=1869181 RepID=UPI0031DB7C5D
MPELTKLKIEAYSDMACTKPVNKSIYAMINPASFSKSYMTTYKSSEEMNKSKDTKTFKSSAARFELNLIIDGTGVVPFPDGISSVDDYIDKLSDVVSRYDGNLHHRYYLKITWGQVLVTGVSEGLTINYKLFDPGGATLRAEAKLRMAETKDFLTKNKEAGKNSPDLTHILTVRAGDTLPLMSYRVYGNSSYYMEVARINNLNSVHAIRPGDQLYFPPLKKI